MQDGSVHVERLGWGVDGIHVLVITSLLVSVSIIFG